MKKILIWSVIGIVLALFVYFQFLKKPPVFIEIQQEVVLQETLYMEVSATGTINPMEMVEVGTQVSGIISEVLVDYNDHVTKGQVIARMDMRILKSALEESKANVIKAEVNFDQTERGLKRTEELFKEGVIAKIELEKAEDDFYNAKAALKIAKLQLEKNSINLGYADIVSPITGIVISKNIEVGQTIAASFSSPVLFTIARDLTEMKIEASIDEADVGQVKPNQKVLFTVDSYPEEEFSGIVTQVHLQPTVIQNVVTYTAIILIQNADLKLMPGMTATLIIQTEEKPNSITVPNSALSFEPDDADLAELKNKKYIVERYSKQASSTVWVLNEKTLKEIPVTVKFSNGIKTSIVSNLVPGDSVITNLKIRIGEKEDGNLFMRPPH